jgi:DNA polymerase-3 subunit gamma/tau
MPADETQLLYSLCLHGRGELGLAPDEYAALTMVLLRLLAFKPRRPSTAEPEKKTLKLAPEPATVSPRTAAATLLAVEPVQVFVAPIAVKPATRPGQQLPVRSDLPGARPSSASLSNPLLAPVDTQVLATNIEAIPVRVQAVSRAEAVITPSSTALVPTEDGAFWHALVQQLIEQEAIAALVRELALQSQLVARDTDQWLLRVDRESLNQPGARDRLVTALQGAGHAVRLVVEVGRVGDSPARRNAAAVAERQLAAEKIIFDDPFVQSMMRDFGAKIVPGSINPG